MIRGGVGVGVKEAGHAGLSNTEICEHVRRKGKSLGARNKLEKLVSRQADAGQLGVGGPDLN